jgi:hypothetical protein
VLGKGVWGGKLIEMRLESVAGEDQAGRRREKSVRGRPPGSDGNIIVRGEAAFEEGGLGASFKSRFKVEAELGPHAYEFPSCEFELTLCGFGRKA